jgi:hypothetical protein
MTRLNPAAAWPFQARRIERPAPCKTGDKITLHRMGNDPDPIPSGATATVRSVCGFGDGTWQISVDWHAPHETRSLSLVYPEDSFSVTEPA